MSRIQNILDKAEREGAVRRIRPVADQAMAGVSTMDSAATFIPPTGVAAETESVAEPEVPPTRVVTDAHLNPRLITAMSPPGVAAEQYRALRTRIVHTETGGAVNVVLVTSPGRGDGKSLTAANLGLAMAQEYQQRICVVDADLRASLQQRLFGLAEGVGLSDVLTGRAALEEALVTVEEHHITVLPAGSPSAHPAELLGTTAMRRVIELPPVVFAEAEHDGVAAEIVARLASEVATLAHVALQRLELEQEPTELLLGGGLLQSADGRLTAAIEAELREVAPVLRIRTARSAPIVGAALLGLDELQAGAAAQQRLRDELAEKFSQIETPQIGGRMRPGRSRR